MKVKHLVFIAVILWYISSCYFWFTGAATEFGNPRNFLEWYTAFGIMFGGTVLAGLIILFLMIYWDRELF